MWMKSYTEQHEKQTPRQDEPHRPCNIGNNDFADMNKFCRRKSGNGLTECKPCPPEEAGYQ